eukprot:TRINITY_DN19749_c0_g1::TRINITY_DN19749_c0_g1_i1::g.11297::m.11297 TRINITY_DN19749_c0_g1::TRINITY_DN19749_c0_g1_i1::g.11297  ORF type:complete len:242 (-),score=18.51,sp/Q7T6Y2/YR831_MIMIV/33.13/5e-18,sp/Q7T6Y2/YR831_MIMIV/25.68/2e-12,Pkinase_Tyr/PF07714.12/3.1e-21,Pkinase/PF00069.20/1e-20,Kinase-like/PF14531.1/0.012 TRINITY_DN19749_c0_g1_i1:33-758(-)
MYLHVIHDPPVTHGNIKASNILWGEDGNFKLTDFYFAHLSTYSSSSTVISEPGSSAYWCPPEVIRGERPSCASDMYAYGMVLWKIIAKELNPFGKLSHLDIMRAIDAGERPPIPSGSSPLWHESWLVDIIVQCWEENPLARPGVTEVYQAIQSRVQFLVDESYDGGEQGQSSSSLSSRTAHQSQSSANQRPLSASHGQEDEALTNSRECFETETPELFSPFSNKGSTDAILIRTPALKALN